MFGYVKVCKPELKIREYEEYKAVYCTLCRVIGRDYGQISRTLLSYDATFYVLLCDCANSSEMPQYQKGRCRFNPAKTCHYQECPGESYSRAAALTVILSYHKLLDTLHDSRFLKRAAAAVFYPILRVKYKKAKARYPQFAEIAETAMSRQSALEQAKCASTDEAAHPSAQALADLFSLYVQDPTQKRVVARTAYCLGRWVYLMDAYDDMRKDLNFGEYNPFLLKYNITDEQALLQNELHEDILRSLHMSANEAAISFDLLNGTVHRSVLENILYDGLEAQCAAVRRAYTEVKQEHV